ncbi:MAG: trigger factor [Crocinitomicaceae bacterium]|nr:trigger factor [Crocinitomicaceae bacterium]|tara:strand:- start:37999 stop:39399 length:1401 start_codon:yes stop_codon:yes gene_type:complete
MDIKQEVIDDLNAVISITVSPDDYQDKVKTILNDYRGKANIPGFRKGHVPFGMVKKMYGEGVLADEMNKILNENLSSYITSEKIEILGNPLPNKDVPPRESLKDGETFEFKYDIGISPKFEVNLDDKVKATYHTIKIDDELLEKYTKDLTRRYGSMKDVEVVGESDLVNGKIDELDAKGEKVEGGIHNHTSIALEYLEKEKSKKALLGKKVDESIVMDPRDFAKGDADVAAMLNISKEEVENIGKKFQFTIGKIHELTPAEVNQDFYDKIFGPETVKTEEEFKERLTADLEKTLADDSDKLFFRDLQDSIKNKLNLQLPEAFLKRWVETSNEKATPEDIEKDWPNFSKGMTWQLIENKIIKENNLEVKFEEALGRTKELFRAQMASYGNQIEEEDLEKAAHNYLMKNREDSEQIYQQLYSEKMLNLFKETVNMKTKEVSFDDFVKLATGNTSKKGILESLSNLVKI